MQRSTPGLIAAALALAAAAACAQTSPMFRITVLPVVGGDVLNAAIYAINDAGVVAGEATVNKPGRPKNRKTVYRWTQAGGLEWSPEGQHGPTYARGVDGIGRVFGTLQKPSGFQGGVLWNRDNHVRAVERGPKGYLSWIDAVNERGDAIGTRAVNRPTFTIVGGGYRVGDLSFQQLPIMLTRVR